MSRRRAFARTGAAFLFAYGAFWTFSNFFPFSLVWNHTASIPEGIYLAEKLDRQGVSPGELACFRYKAPAWAKERHYFPDGFQLCKYVTGLQHEVLAKKEGEWVVQTQEGTSRRVGGLALTDSQGKPLPQDALKEGPIPSGMVVMAAPAHKNSLDSRYLGELPLQALTMRIRPLITW